MSSYRCLILLSLSMCATHIEGSARLGTGCAGVMLVGLEVSCMIRLQSGLLCQFIANIPWLISLTTVGRSRHDYNFLVLNLILFYYYSACLFWIFGLC